MPTSVSSQVSDFLWYLTSSLSRGSYLGETQMIKSEVKRLTLYCMHVKNHVILEGDWEIMKCSDPGRQLSRQQTMDGWLYSDLSRALIKEGSFGSSWFSLEGSAFSSQAVPHRGIKEHRKKWSVMDWEGRHQTGRTFGIKVSCRKRRPSLDVGPLGKRTFAELLSFSVV